MKLENHPTVQKIQLTSADPVRPKQEPREREHDRKLIPGAQSIALENGGHFFPLDSPDAMIEVLRKTA